MGTQSTWGLRLGCCAFPRQLASEDGPEGDEEGHEGIWQGLEQGRPRRGHLHGDRVEEEGLHEGHGQLGCRGHEQVKSAGKVTIPGLCMIKTRVKPATKAGKREMFGKMVVVKAKPAKTVVKAYCVAALKNSI